MKLVEEFTMQAMLKPPVMMGQGPLGLRNYYEIISGEITGDRIKAKVFGGGDWALVGSDGAIRLDVRLQAETDDGALLYAQYSGILVPNEKLLAAMTSAGGTEYGDQYFYSNPRFETGDPRYAWLNTTFFVGQGRAIEGFGVGYRVYRPA
jgi:hypothetical protein